MTVTAEPAPLDRAPGATPSAVSATDVTRTYGSAEAPVDALRGVTLDVAAGEFTVVMGPSGSGKSTLMHILAGLDRPTSGAVSIGGRDITSLDDRQLTLLRRRHIGFVFQAFNLLPMLTAEENVMLRLQLTGEAADPAWVTELLETVGLFERRHHRPAQLSGGQQQRVALARALVTSPEVLFADEPTGNLDSSASQEVLALLRRATDLHGVTVLLVTHDPRAAAIADRIIHLADGRIVSDRERARDATVLMPESAVLR
ncbi:MAG: ABC transporter ATP-binding protein [Solirubrobacterales bacterium]|nr:ABC transporter ATP-binding protein [Solirubrobacterales bacterium]